jgi:LPS-assembly protein
VTTKKDVLPQIDSDTEAAVHIEADSLTYDRQADQYIAEGRVEIVRSGMILRADRVVLDNRTRLATADGKVEVLQEGARIWSDRIELHLDEQTGRLVRGTLFFEPYNLTVQGDEIERLSPERYRVRGATLSTCGGDTPDWRFAAKEVELTVAGEAVARDATFQVLNVPVLYLPYLIYPTRTDRRTGFLMPEYRSSARIGYGFSLPFFWAIHQSYDATLTESYFTKKGFQQGLEFRYAPSESLKGSIQGEFLHDKEDPDSLVNHRGGVRTESDRWRVRMEQEARLPWGIFSRADVDVVSDNYYLEELSAEHDERYLRYLTSIVNATKRWDSYLLAGEGRYFRDLVAPQNDNGGTLQRAPSLLFHRVQLPVAGLPLAMGWNTSFDHFWREEGSTAEILGLAPGVSLPIELGRYFRFVPFGQWEEKLYLTQGEPGGGTDGRFGTYRYGASLSTEFFRTYPVGGERIQSFKHTLQPEIRYDAIGHSSQGDFPEDFLDRVPSDRLVSLALTQFLTGKVLKPSGDLGFREFARLRLVQSFSLREEMRDLDEPRDERRPFLPGLAELDLRLLGDREGRPESEIRKGVWMDPHQYLVLKFRQAYDWYDQEWDDLSATIRGGDGRGDEASVSYSWLRRPIEGTPVRKVIKANVGIRTLPILDVVGNGWYDHESDRWIRYGYGFILHPSCWAIRFSHMIEPSWGGRETDHSFRFQVYLLGLDRVAKF